MLVERPPVPRYGEIEVDGVKYKFRVKKSTQKFSQVVLLNYVTEKYVKEIFRVPKDLSIGTKIETAENKVLLLRSEVKPPAHWGKAYHYSKRGK
jgi:hypothetical protein